MQRLYVTALEDSLILLQEIRPAYRNLQIITRLQNEEKYAAEKQHMFEIKVRNLQIEELNQTIRKERKKRVSSIIKSVGAGLLIGLIVGTIF